MTGTSLMHRELANGQPSQGRETYPVVGQKDQVDNEPSPLFPPNPEGLRLALEQLGQLVPAEFRSCVPEYREAQQHLKPYYLEKLKHLSAEMKKRLLVDATEIAKGNIICAMLYEAAMNIDADLTEREEAIDALLDALDDGEYRECD